MEDNQMVSFNEMIEAYFKGKDVYIPLIQRNYKWDAKTAATLAAELWKAFNRKQKTYTIGMITLFEESNEKFQLIDGQQRIVTLYMLLKYLAPNDEAFTFRFERDDGVEDGRCTRADYIKQISNPQVYAGDMYTDLNRFKTNYEAIVLAMTDKNIDEEKCIEFAKYIMSNTYFLLHISNAEPFDEFINLNKNKTRFVISDRIKANLIINSKTVEKRDAVLELFRNLSKLIFSNQEIWELIKKGYEEEKPPANDRERIKYKLYPDENRLKLLCCERYGSDEYDTTGTPGYDYGHELEVLQNYLTILDTLRLDLESRNWNAYNGFNCLYKLDNIQKKAADIQNALRFFSMLKRQNFKCLEEYLINEWKGLKEPFENICFIESQLCSTKEHLTYIDEILVIRAELNESEEKKENWLCNGSREFENFQQIYDEYINDKYKK